MHIRLILPIEQYFTILQSTTFQGNLFLNTHHGKEELIKSAYKKAITNAFQTTLIYQLFFMELKRGGGIKLRLTRGTVII